MEVYLVTNGNGLEAIQEFYKEALGAAIEQVNLFKDFLPDCPAELENYVMNAQFRLPNGQRFMLSDNQPNARLTAGDNITVALITDDAEAAKDFYDKLCKVLPAINMELKQFHDAPAYGNVTDKFGISWQVNAEVADYGQGYYF